MDKPKFVVTYRASRTFVTKTLPYPLIIGDRDPDYLYLVLSDRDTREGAHYFPADIVAVNGTPVPKEFLLQIRVKDELYTAAMKIRKGFRPEDFTLRQVF